MKSYRSILLLLLFAADCWAEPMQFLQSPSALADAKRRSNASGKKVIYDDEPLGTVTANPSDNVAAANAILASIGRAGDTQYNYGYSGRGLRHPAYFPAGAIPLNKADLPIYIGRSRATNPTGSAKTPVQLFGGRVETGGGMSITQFRGDDYDRLANITYFYPVGDDVTPGQEQPLIRYCGYGWWIGPMELRGGDIATSTHWNQLAADTFPHWPVGFEVAEPPSPTGSFPEGKLFHAGIAMAAFDVGINVGDGTHCDNLSWGYLWALSCDTMYKVDNIQSLSHIICKLTTSSNVGIAFDIVEGGNVHVLDWSLLGESCTLFNIGNFHRNRYGFVVDNLGIDNLATDPTLVNFTGATGSRHGCYVSIRGFVQEDCDYDPELLITGDRREDDRIFIHMEGKPAVVADFNDLSTINADGTWRTKSFTVQVTPLGSNLTTGDGKAYFRIPAELDGWRLEHVAGSLDVASSSGIPTFQVRRKRSGSDVDMFTTKITIDANETDTAGAAAAQAINASNDDVAEGDRLYFDCDVAGTNAQGFQAYLTFRRY